MSKKSTDGPTDGLKYGEWEPRYPEQARKQIYAEAIYLAVHLIVCPITLFFLWNGSFQAMLGLSTSPDKYLTVFHYGCAWLVGTLGGTLYSIKWLYRSVARQIWHVDRRLWRLFTPHISGALSFCMVALISSGIINVFNSSAIKSGSSIAGISFLVGYFSDSAIAKLAEVADTLFGQRKTEESGSDEDDSKKNGDATKAGQEK